MQKQFQPAADQGDAQAEERLGHAYRYGFGAPADKSLALNWFRKAAAQGYAPAEFELGCSYEYGIDVPEDAAQAVGWYRLAVRHGAAYAMTRLGGFYADGYGVPRDYVIAYMLSSLAAAHGASTMERGAGSAAGTALLPRMTAEQVTEAQAYAATWEVGSELPEKSQSGTVFAHPDQDGASAVKEWRYSISSRLLVLWDPPTEDVGKRVAYAQATVDPQGRTVVATISSSSGDLAFDQSALQALQQTQLQSRAAAAFNGKLDLCFAWVEQNCVVRPGLVIVSGPRSLLNVQLGMDRGKATIIEAYRNLIKTDAALKQHPDQRIEIRMTISAAGAVLDCAPVSTTLDDADFTSGIVDAVKTIRFGHWTGPDFVLARYPIDFHPM